MMIDLEKRKLLIGAGCVFAATAAALATKGVIAMTHPVSTPITTLDPREHKRQKYFQNVPLITHNGEVVHFYDDLLKDKKVVINFRYTGCTKTCPPVMQNMLEARRLLGDFAKDIHFYSFSLTPLSDTPAELRKLMATQGISEGWTFLTGTQENIDIARRGLGFTSRDPVEDADVTKHGGMIRIGNESTVSWSHAQGFAPGKTIARMIRYELG